MTGLKAIPFVLLLTFSGFAQTQTTGAITGAVRDQQGALVGGAAITVGNKQTGEVRMTVTDETGAFAVALLAPGTYRIRAEAAGFSPFIVETMTVSVAESTLVDLVLAVAGPVTTPVIVNTEAPAVKTGNATLGQVFDGPRAADLPMATRNFTQLLILAPGTSAFLVDNTVVGRNTLNVSVNGARTSQNNFQINGIDANFGVNSSRQVASPAPESVAEFRTQTSLYDATFGRAGGGNIQVVTRSGTNKFGGGIYDYFGNTALNANNPFLKASGQPRPVLDRNIFGVTLGGPLKSDRAFFFVSYQTTRENNGASRLNSLSSNVLVGTVDTALTDDRTEAGLGTGFPTQLPIHPLSLALLNARLSNGTFLIPTPNLGSRYNGSAISTFREEQFNANFDYRLTAKNLLSTKVFFAHV